MIKKKKKKHGAIVLLGKGKLNTIGILISIPLIDSCISQNKFVSVDNMLREYNKMEEEKKILKLLWNTLNKYC